MTIAPTESRTAASVRSNAPDPPRRSARSVSGTIIPRYDFWRDHPNAARWRWNRPYRWATWGLVAGWFPGTWSEPSYYSYGDNIYYEDDTVYYGDEAVASSEEYAQQAQTIARECTGTSGRLGVASAWRVRYDTGWPGVRTGADGISSVDSQQGGRHRRNRHEYGNRGTSSQLRAWSTKRHSVPPGWLQEKTRRSWKRGIANLTKDEAPGFASLRRRPDTAVAVGETRRTGG